MVGASDDLTVVWREALVVLGRGPLTVAGLAEALGVTRRTAQRRADALVRRGYAEYLPNAAHRRARLVQVTDPIPTDQSMESRNARNTAVQRSRASIAGQCPEPSKSSVSTRPPASR